MGAEQFVALTNSSNVELLEKIGTRPFLQGGL